MQKYDECLTDIEMAKKTGYPVEKMKKLDDRITECLKGTKNDRKIVRDTIKLTLEPDEKYPCMATV